MLRQEELTIVLLRDRPYQSGRDDLYHIQPRIV
jgi:hypothetical protein